MWMPKDIYHPIRSLDRIQGYLEQLGNTRHNWDICLKLNKKIYAKLLNSSYAKRSYYNKISCFPKQEEIFQVN